LTEEQVGSIDKLPKRLIELQKRGLQIKLCPDKIRSHTKYFYAMKEHPKDIIITVDDDLFYRTDLIERHIEAHNKYPKAIIANWVKEILPTTNKYNEWSTRPIFDEETRKELLKIAGKEEEIKDRFYKDLEFGTAGMRGIIGNGTNRMNVYTVTKATQGLANYILRQSDFFITIL
jgi:hypothetical protein